MTASPPDRTPPARGATQAGEEPIGRPPPRRSLLHQLALERPRLLRARIERARQHRATLDAALAAIERDSEIGGGILAGALAYRLFVFALPLAFFLVSVLGLLTELFGTDAETIGEDAGLAGLVTEQVAAAASSPSNWLVALTSFAVLAYVTRVLLRAMAIVHALAWERSAAAVTVSSRSLAVFSAAIVGQIGLVAGVGAVRQHMPAGGVAVLVVFLLAVAGIWLAVSLQLPHSDAPWTALVPGALLYAAGILAVQVFNAYVLGRLLESKASTYGTLGGAAAVLLGLFLIGRVAVGAAVLNATLFERRATTRRSPG